MPIILLGILVIIGCLGYIFIVNNPEKFIRKKPKKNDPFDVIYLPDDLEAAKKEHKDKT